ncbi:unnamed protein product [Kuraishia capsulata CBS 1993]|uniref:IMP-specific 5'-nucleotidase 1 n=1 Tax=Kuraishia capsulata CBS 1993 TaxID=1382522 RepID=W6MUF3_9ASCO|nr:uncharacterized protein KUCA_T00005220001 [Kuraishia capsulata CBS 1993]CDK29232.1 unnamed protein product [Kuraishia capsulata CBS 1993]
MQDLGTHELARLKQLIPSIGLFFTRLPLEKAFYIEDERRAISKRRLVAPSFNDIRVILNTAQILELSKRFHRPQSSQLKLITFDGDVTLYEDGKSMEHDSPIIPHLVSLLSQDVTIGVVTAAGYSDPSGLKYEERLHGLLAAVAKSPLLTSDQRENLFVMGGESNYLFRFNSEAGRLVFVPEEDWTLKSMREWAPHDVVATLDFAESILRELVEKLALPAQLIRKEKGVGIVPLKNHKIQREQLEEVVLRCDKRLRAFPPAKRIRFCAFNGGSDVWVDIGDKSLGVQSLQEFLSKKDPVGPANTLHVGDQFAALGANDYKARLSGCTVWVANPGETNAMLTDLLVYMSDWAKY